MEMDVLILLERLLFWMDSDEAFIIPFVEKENVHDGVKMRTETDILRAAVRFMFVSLNALLLK